ncbi:MAG: hypothetical protein ACOY40_16425 [Bacillota bacterium]
MITRAKKIEDEITSLASSIKKNMVDPAGQRMHRLELRVAAAERTIVLLTRAFFAAAVAFAAAAGTLVYYLATN